MLNCYSLFNSDVRHCSICHNSELLTVTLNDGREVEICGSVADFLYESGELSLGEYKRFVCRKGYS